jgi:hypothetical protein
MLKTIWMHSGFKHYYFERTHPRLTWEKAKPFTREAVWKEWVTEVVGK